MLMCACVYRLLDGLGEDSFSDPTADTSTIKTQRGVHCDMGLVTLAPKGSTQGLEALLLDGIFNFALLLF